MSSPGCGFILVLICEGHFMSLSADKKADIIDAFNTAFRYLDE